MLSKLAHVCIETADLAATESFYRCLGLRRQFDFRNQTGELVGFYLKFGDRTFVEVIAVEQVRPEGAVRHFAIETDDINAVHAALRAAGYQTGEPHMASDHNRMLTCHDPNGVFIEIQEYGPDSLQLRGGTCPVDYAPRPASSG